MNALAIFKGAVICAVVLTASACRHPLAISGDGDILSSSGLHDCLLEDFENSLPSCTENLIEGNYQETYTATPRAGYQFRRWGNYCKDALNNECSFDVAGSVVDQFDGQTLFPLQAVFRPDVNTGFTAIFMGNELFDPIAGGLAFHANAAGFIDHETTTYFAAGDFGAPEALWDDNTARAAIQADLDAGDVELVGMTYVPAYPSVDGYRDWIDYALAQNLDTRFFIATPWSSDPDLVDSATYEADFEATHAAVHALVDQLRNEFKGVDIYCVPTGHAAVTLHALHGDSNLPDVSALVGPAASSVFANSAGAPGDILDTLSELVWLNAIYAVDLSTYAFDPGYIADLKGMAADITAEHYPTYNAPDEIDVDTDGDGIVDRLDPNPTGKKNILLIVADDLGYNDLAINNSNTMMQTPNMDQLALDGVRFTRHYAQPTCSPARAALMTGVFPERVAFIPQGRGIPHELVTIPEQLKTDGYATWHIGKWHLGDLERTAWPDYQGFDHWFGFLSQWKLAGQEVNGEIVVAPPRYDNPYLVGDSEPGQHYTGHLDNILTDKAIDVLSELRDRKEPWFMNLWFFAPHSPIDPVAEFAALYPATDEGRYRALVHQLDHNIGLVLAHLDSIGAADDTIVVVVSDNGGTNKQIDNNAPFNGNKNTLLEGALRTPLIIKWPDAALNGQVFDDAVSIMDIFPTLIESVDLIPTPNLDGASFLGSVAQTQPTVQKDLFWKFGHEGHGAITADGQWRLYQIPEFGGTTFLPIIYDLLMDPTGTQETNPTPPLILAQMLGDHDIWHEAVHDVPMTYTPDGMGGGTLTGSDMMRTPGFAEFSFGMGMPDTHIGQLAAQLGLWDMSRSGNTITANFGPLTLSGDVVNSNPCHNIVVTGKFNLKIAHISPDDEISMSLYIDEQLVDSGAVAARLDVTDPSVPTIVGDPGVMGDPIASPVIRNARLDADSTWTLVDFSQTLCGP